MSPHTFCLLSLAILLPVAVQAETPEAPASKAPAGPYVLKNRSTFQAVGDDQRAPFWPIGWSKRKPMSVTDVPVQRIEPVAVRFDASSIKLTSILLGTPSLAIINGRSYSEGDFLRTAKPTAGTVATPQARVRVYRINDGHVILQHQNDLVTVALQRPELVQRSSVEDLLTEDRP